MKVPLGIFIESQDAIKNKHLISPVDMGHYLRLPAGISFSEPLKGEEVTVIEKLRQVITQILKICEKNDDPSTFKKATEKLPKMKTRNFTKALELKEREVVFLDVTQTNDLMPPDGALLKKLLCSYPDFYKNSKKRDKLSKIIEIVESGTNVYILNDLYLTLENRKVLEYGDKLTKEFVSKIKPELKAILKPRRKEDFMDKLSTGEDIIRMDLFNYYAIPLKKSGELLDENFLNSVEFKKLLQGDPEVFYQPENIPEGIFLFEQNTQTGSLIKKIFKLHHHHFIDEFNTLDNLYENIKTRNPAIVIISLESTSEIDKIIQEVKDIESYQMNKYNLKTDYIFIVNPKSAEIENNLRSNGFTFILDKQIILNNFKEFETMLNDILNILVQ